MDITTTTLSHLGLVSGTFDELGIADIIDANIPKSRNHNLSHSTVIKAMCLNGLGFNESRLYLYSDYFENLPTERLLGEGILPAQVSHSKIKTSSVWQHASKITPICWS